MSFVLFDSEWHKFAKTKQNIKTKNQFFEAFKLKNPFTDFYKASLID